MPDTLPTTPDGILLVLAVMLPFAGMLVAFAFGGRNAQRIALLTILATAGVCAAITAAALRGDTSLVYHWAAGRRRSASRCARIRWRW